MILDDFKLNGKTALVTGSSRGLGAAIALALAEAGAHVALHGSRGVPDAIQQTVAQAAAANGMRTIAVNGDVSQDAACVRMVDEVVSEFGYIDILIPRLSFDGNLSCLHPVTCFAAARYRSYPCF